MLSIRRGGQLGGLGTKHVGTPGRHWPRAPGRAPRFSLQDGDIPEPGSQAAAAPHTSETDSAGPGSGSRIRRRGPGPEPAAKQPPLRPRPGGAKRKMVRALGPARGEASRRLRAASVPRAAPGLAGRPAPRAAEGCSTPPFWPPGAAELRAGKARRNAGRAQPHPGPEAWHPPPCPPTLTAQLRGMKPTTRVRHREPGGGAATRSAAQREAGSQSPQVSGQGAGRARPLVPAVLGPPRSFGLLRAPSGSSGLLRAPSGISALLRAPPRSSALFRGRRMR